jgi:putative tryptophan/tyrosine transport system substrate-binding protein
VNRRHVLAGLAITVLWPARGVPQTRQKVYRIGFLGSASPTAEVRRFATDPLRQGLRELGWVEGQNIVIEERWAEGRVERQASNAAELVRLKVDVLVAGVNDAALAAKHATSTIPIVMTLVSDPVRAGLIKSYAKPGGNVTGMSYEPATTLTVKHLDLLKEITPGLARVAVLWNTASESNRQWVSDPEVAAAAHSLGLKLTHVGISDGEELEGAFERMKHDGAGALHVSPDPMLFHHRERIRDLAIKHRLPSISAMVAFAEHGGLMWYGMDAADSIRRSARYVDQILRGAKPADLAVEQPTKFQLTVNLRTARAIGMSMSRSIVLRADRVIE